MIQKKSLLLGVVLLGLAAGCSAGTESRASLNGVLGDFDEAREKAFSLHLDGEGEDVEKLSQELGWSTWTRDVATDGLLRISLDGGENMQDPRDNSLGVAFDLGGEEVLRVSILEEDVYLRLDGERLVEERAELEDEVNSIRDAVSRTPQLSSLTPLLEGEWGRVDFETLNPQEKAQLEEWRDELREEVEKKSASLLDSVKALVENGKVTQEESGTYQIEVNSQEAYESIRPFLGEGNEKLPPLDSIPEEMVRFEIKEDGGELKKVEVDLSQFSSREMDEVKLVLEMDESIELETPEDFVDLDISPLLSYASSLLEGTS